jgi:hypothetical protein
MVDENHVAAGAFEQCGENLIWAVRSVVAKDTLLCDAACDFDSGITGDLTQNLVEAGVVRGDGERAVGVSDLRSLWRALRWREGNWRRFGCCR